MQLFEDQSPIYHVRDIKTPFMILHGTADNAVDWHQGLELYGAARRWGKQVILLSYPGEPHHLAKKENQKDFQLRMKQFFDHYLKGTPGAEVDDRRRAADEEGWTDRIAVAVRIIHLDQGSEIAVTHRSIARVATTATVALTCAASIAGAQQKCPAVTAGAKMPLTYSGGPTVPRSRPAT